MVHSYEATLIYVSANQMYWIYPIDQSGYV